MHVIDPAGFEALFRANPDPWNYATSRFEAYKRTILLRACGPNIRGRALELACANGETTRALAPKCLRLLALDVSPTAVGEASRRLAGMETVTTRQALLPADLPRQPFDLIVVSELLYYLSASDSERLIVSLARSTAPGGRVVLLHHHVDFDDAAQHPNDAHRNAVRSLARVMSIVFHHRDRRFDCVALARGG